MREEYDIFMGKYEEDHQCCPKCGSELYRTTLIDYIVEETLYSTNFVSM